MSQTNPIGLRAPPGFHESSGQRSQRDTDAIGKMWLKNRQIADSLANHGQVVQQLQRQLDRLRRRRPQAVDSVTFFPFQVYTSPAYMTAEQATAAGTALTPSEPDATPDALASRTFRVRAGAVETTAVLKTDGADANPDDPALPNSAAYSTSIDITLPNSVATNFIFIDRHTDALKAAPAIASAATAPGNWWTFDYILIAVVDTTASPPVVRQYLRADVPGPLNVCSPDA